MHGWGWVLLSFSILVLSFDVIGLFLGCEQGMGGVVMNVVEKLPKGSRPPKDTAGIPRTSFELVALTLPS